MPKSMEGVMKEFKQGKLHSGSSRGRVVSSRKQAIAIGLSEQRAQGKKVAPKPKKRRGKKSTKKRSTRPGSVAHAMLSKGIPYPPPVD